MQSMLASIGGQFSKPFLIGMMLPALIFSAIVDLSLNPTESFLLPPEGVLSLQGLTVFIGLVTLALLLYLFNIPIYRLLEGYTWASTKIGRWCTVRHQAALRGLQLRTSALVFFGEREQDDPQRATAAEIGDELLDFSHEYPFAEEYVLPTRLGNVMRHHELYALEQYGMDTIVLWPRLLAVLEQDYAEAIQDARTHLDFAVNTAFLMLLVAALQLPMALMTSTYPLTQAFIVGVTSLLVGYALYLSAIDNARGWGELIKGVSDLYRWKLLERLGLRQRPGTLAEEREIWLNVTRQLEYGDKPGTDGSPTPRFEYAPATPEYPSVEADEKAQLALFRSFRQDRWDTIDVLTTLSNAGDSAVDRLLLRDRMRPGYLLAKVADPQDGYSLTVKGTDPYEFELRGALPPAHTLTLEYTMVRDRSQT